MRLCPASSLEWRLTHAGIDIPRPNPEGKTSPDELMRFAYASLVNVQYEELAPSLDELMRCVSDAACKSPKTRHAAVRVFPILSSFP